MLRDFHAVAAKLFDGESPHRLRPGGDYFDAAMQERPVAFPDLLPEEVRAGLRPVLLRRWTVGEVLTAVAESSFRIRHVREEPHAVNPLIPGWLALVAEA